MPATFIGHGILVREMPRQFSAEAALRGGEEVDDAPDALHIAPFSVFDIRVERPDHLTFRLLASWEFAQDAEPIDDAAGMELDGPAVVPFLEFPDSVGAREAARGRGGVDVDAGVFVGRLAGFFEGLGDGGGVRRGKGFEGGGFDVFVFGVFGGDCSDEAEAEFKLGVEEIEGGFLEGLVRGVGFQCGFGGAGGGLTRMSHSLDSSFRFRSMTSPALAYRLSSRNSPTNPLTLLKLGTSALDHSSMILISSAQR